MKYIRKFEEKNLKLIDASLFINPKIKRKMNGGNKSEKILKYKKNDIVVFEPNQQPYIITGFNNLSDDQDYWLVNPLLSDRVWVCEEELRDATSEEKEEIETYLISKKYNL